MPGRRTTTVTTNGVDVTSAATIKKRPSFDETHRPPSKRVKATATTKTTTAKTAKAPVKVPAKVAAKTKEPTTSVKSTVERKAKSKSPVPKQRINSAPTRRLQVYVFGEGSSGELGLGAERKAIDVKRPRLNTNLDANSVGVVDIADGGMHAVALTHDNKILTWGVNDQGALGRDTNWDGGLRDVDDDDDDDSDSESSDSGLNPFESTPTAVPTENFPTGTKFVQVAAGDSSTFALTDQGIVYGWGTFRDSNGILGFTVEKGKSEPIVQQSKPMLIPGLKDITQIAVGSDYALALDSKGNVFAWGNGQQDQLGRRLVERRRLQALLPMPVGLPKNKIVSIHAASNHAFAIDDKGDTWAWGLNNFAQTGIPDHAGEGGNSVTAPRKVNSLVGMKMKMVRGGSHHSIGLTEDGKTFVWGRIDGAQAGVDLHTLPLDDASQVMVERGKPRILLKPYPVNLPRGASVAAASDHNIVVTADGKAFSWGFNANYQCGQGGNDDIDVATLIDNTAVRDKKLIWAGAGGQFSMLASYADKPTTNGHPITNGVHAPSNN